MIRYSAEVKAAAIAAMEKDGVTKVHKDMNISVQTLYAWSKAAKAAAGEEPNALDEALLSEPTAEASVVETPVKAVAAKKARKKTAKPAAKATAKKTTAAKAAKASKPAEETPVAAESAEQIARSLLEEADGDAETIAFLKQENQRLNEQNAKLRKALTALLA